MTRLYLADSQRRALARLGQIDEHEATGLVEAFERLPAYLPTDALVTAAANAAPALRRVDDVILTLLALTTETRLVQPDEIARLLRDSLESEQLDGVAVAVDRVVDVVTRLTSTRAVRTSANAHEVLAQHDRNYQSARIFTDLRPLFEKDPEQPPSGAAIVEMLQLETWSEDGQTETLRVAMDRTDLIELRGVIDRAIKKTNSLRKLMNDAGIASFELGDYMA